MIREANIHDSSRLGEIHTLGWRHAYKEFIPMDYLINKMTIKNQEEKFKGYLSDKNNHYKINIYEDNGIIKGFMTMADSEDEDKNNTSFELAAIYIDPLFQRQRIGTDLVNYCLEYAKKNGKIEMLVWVYEKNYGSIEFYKKIGFSPDGKNRMDERFNEKVIRLRMDI